MIIILTQCFPPRIGGIENLIFNLSYFLSKKNKVIVLADQNNFFKDRIFDNKYKDKFLIRRFGGIKYFRKINKIRELKKIIDFQNVKAIIGDSWKSLETPLQKLKHKDLPYICLIHGNEIIVKNNRHQKRILNTFIKVKKIISNSEFTKQLALKAVPSLKNIEVIYPGVSNFDDITEEKVKLTEGNPVLLTLARLERRKGHEKIIYTISKLIKDYPDILYIVAGEGDEKGNLVSLVKDLDISKNVIFIGSISESQKKFIFSKTDLMVMPTLDETDKLSIEGFGIAYIEAALFGIPSIASNFGGAQEAVLNNKTGIILDDLDDLETCIRDLIENSDKRKYLGKNAQKRAFNELSWNNQIIKYNKILQTI